MSDVKLFTGITPLPFDADIILNSAKGQLKSVIIIGELRHPRAKGYEWLFADFDEIAAHTDAFLRANCIMFEREDLAA